MSNNNECNPFSYPLDEKNKLPFKRKKKFKKYIKREISEKHKQEQEMRQDTTKENDV